MEVFKCSMSRFKLGVCYFDGRVKENYYYYFETFDEALLYIPKLEKWRGEIVKLSIKKLKADELEEIKKHYFNINKLLK